MASWCRSKSAEDNQRRTSDEQPIEWVKKISEENKAMNFFKNLLVPEPDRRSTRQISGQKAEDAALHYLQHRQLTLIERNFSCKGGEIDLIMLDGAVQGRLQEMVHSPYRMLTGGVAPATASLVFVEVRQRADRRHGGAAASVTATKQRRLIIAAQHFLQRYRQPPACRFDVIAIDGEVTEWIKNAFDA